MMYCMTDFGVYTPDPLGFATYLIDMHGDKIRYATDTSRFYKYTGTHWQECSPGNVEIEYTIDAVSQYLAATLGPQPDKDSPEHRSWAVQNAFVKLGGGVATSTIMNKMRANPRLWCTLNDFATKPYLINFRNGTVNVRQPWQDDEGEIEVYFHPHDPQDMVATVLSHKYPEYEMPDTPKWSAMLNHMCGGDPEYALSLEKALAYGLIGENPEQVMVFLVGEPNIGKTQALEVVAELAGTLGGHGKVELIQYTRGSEHDSVRADLRGKHFVMLGETSHKLNLDEMKFKDLTGARYIPTRKLGQEPVPTKVTWTLYCATNELPEVPGEMDDAIARRLWLFPLPGKQIPKSERDPSLTAQIIREEGAAILYRLVRHLSEWYAFGKAPEHHVQSLRALDNYQAESNTVADFAVHMLHEDANGWVSYDDLAIAYQEFCKKRNLRPVSRKMLPRRIEQVMLTCQRDSNHSRMKGVAINFEAPSWQS